MNTQVKRYLTLDEAAAALSEKSTVPITLRDLRDLAARGEIHLCFLYHGQLAAWDGYDEVTACETFRGYLRIRSREVPRVIEGVWHIEDPVIIEPLPGTDLRVVQAIKRRLEEFPPAELRTMEFAHTSRYPDGNFVLEKFEVDVCDLLVPAHAISRFSSVDIKPANESNDDTLGSQQQSALSTKPVPRLIAQENEILEKLRELGFDPMKLPPHAPGKRSPAKQQVRKALGLTDAVFKKAWQRLSNNGDISDA